MTDAARSAAAESTAKDHGLVAPQVWQASKGLRFEKRPVKGEDGKPVAGLYNAWITLDNPTQFNSYTTEMVKATILAFRAASAARDVVAVVFTGSGDRAFCTGGNTKEYAEYYAGNPQEYRPDLPERSTQGEMVNHALSVKFPHSSSKSQSAPSPPADWRRTCRRPSAPGRCR